jgi:hypothetical protein
LEVMETILLPGKQARLPRISEIGLRRPPAKPHEPYDNEVGKRWTEIAKATDSFKGLPQCRLRRPMGLIRFA